MSKLTVCLVFAVALSAFCSCAVTKLKDGEVNRGEDAKSAEGKETAGHRVPPGLIVPPHVPPFGSPPNFDGVPPGFDKVLPEEVLTKLRDLHKNPQIPIHQKQVEFDRIMSAVPAEVLAQLPLPPGFEALPDKLQERVRSIHGDSRLDWAQKTRKVHELIESLPQEQRPRPPPGFPPLPPPGGIPGDHFPPNPPPGFEKVLPPETYKQLVGIHRNPKLGPLEKGQQIDLVMRSLPQEVIDQLPLPPGFEQLPERELKQARAIFGDKTLSFQEKDRKVFEFVKSLPPNLRRLVRPPLPPAFERLSPETKESIANLFDDDSLDDGQRQKRFWELVSALPKQEKGQVQNALVFPA